MQLIRYLLKQVSHGVFLLERRVILFLVATSKTHRGLHGARAGRDISRCLVEICPVRTSQERAASHLVQLSRAYIGR